MRSRTRQLVLLTLACAASLRAADGDAASEMRRWLDIYRLVDREGASPFPNDVAIYQGAIPAMLRTLDPHSTFFGPEQFEQLQQLQTGERRGFGTIVSLLPGRIIVLQAAEGSSAARAGISAGDEILAINGYQIAYYDVEQLQQLLSLLRQGEVNMDIRHPGAERTVHIVMSPGAVEESTVERAFHIAPGIGYIKVKSFDEPTGRLTQQAIESLGGEFLKGLVIDLRDNPGGVVTAALDMASLFLSSGQVVFSASGRHAGVDEVRVNDVAAPYTFPVAILMNKNSASASEIVAGALQDHDRAVILGEPSYGKGLVQRVFPLSGNTGMALTTAFYYTPSGRSIQKPLRGSQLEGTTDVERKLYLSDSGRALRGGGGIDPDEEVQPATRAALQVVIDASGILTSFAGELVRARSLTAPPVFTPQLLAELRAYMGDRRIQPDNADWNAHRDWIEDRLQQEFLNLTKGVAAGDELELARDAVVRAALRKLRGAN